MIEVEYKNLKISRVRVNRTHALDIVNLLPPMWFIELPRGKGSVL